MTIKRAIFRTNQNALMEIFSEALSINSHFELLLWLQGKFQEVLPHDVMIASWGDFSLGLIYFDIVSPLPGLRTDNIKGDDINPTLMRHYHSWQTKRHMPDM